MARRQKKVLPSAPPQDFPTPSVYSETPQATENQDVLTQRFEINPSYNHSQYVSNNNCNNTSYAFTLYIT